jgi:hypothetical protein
MKYFALFGLAGGAIVAAGQLTVAQWHAAISGLLVLVSRYGPIVLPWALAALFAWLWWRQRGIAAAFRDGYLDKVVNPVRRKRATR